MSKPTYAQVHIDTALTNIAVAYSPGGFIADQIFPAVAVNKISNKYFIYTKADWLRREAQVRAPGTRAARGDCFGALFDHWALDFAYQFATGPATVVTQRNAVNCSRDAAAKSGCDGRYALDAHTMVLSGTSNR